MIPVEKLQEIINLSKKATPGPYWMGVKHGEDILDVNKFMIDAAAFEPERFDLWMVGAGYPPNPDDCRLPAITGNGPVSEVNAAYIVSACNSAAEMAEEIIRLREQMNTCEWSKDKHGNWKSTCGEIFNFEDGGLEGNCTYCHHCGKKIKETEVSNE